MQFDGRKNSLKEPLRLTLAGSSGDGNTFSMLLVGRLLSKWYRKRISTSCAMILKGRREGTVAFAEDGPDENSGKSWKTESRSKAALSRLRS